MKAPKISTDFNGFLAVDLLCLAHCETPTDHSGALVELSAGMYAIAFEEDADSEGNPEFLVASGLVERSPEQASHNGSVWSLRVDSRGVRYLATLEGAD